MATNLNRWLKYAKAKLESTVSTGNDELDRLEARQEAERAERPWLGADRDAPSFEEAQARIRWEAERTEAGPPPGSARKAAPSVDQAEVDDVDALDTATAAEQHGARIELDARAKQSADRLDQIRRELGVADPAAPNDDPQR